MDNNVEVVEPHKYFDGLRVFVVDDNGTCLTIVKRMLQMCQYKVATCGDPNIALSILRERKGEFDLVLTNAHMHNMDAFKLLEHVTLELGLPVIMMSDDNHKEVIVKGLERGACFYLIKPIQMVELRSIWQHVYVKKYYGIKASEQVEDNENSGRKMRKKFIKDVQKITMDAVECASSANMEKMKQPKRGIDVENDEDEKDSEDASASKKARVVWNPELHSKFLNVVESVGIDKVVPKKILEFMNIPGLTRENVASHLQKHRRYLKRIQEPSNPFLDEAINNRHGQLRSNYGRIPHKVMPNKQKQPCLSQFSEESNKPTKLQPGFLGNNQISYAPMNTPSTNSMIYLTEQEKSNFLMNRLRHGPSLQRNKNSLNQIQQGNNLQTKASYFQQFDGNLGCGVLLQQNQRMDMSSHGGISTGHMKGIDRWNVLHQQQQGRHGFFENRKLDNFSIQNAQGKNNSLSTIRRTLDELENHHQINSANNSIDAQLQCSRGQLGSNKIGLTQTGEVGEPLNNFNSTLCEVAISTKEKDLSILGVNSNFSYGTLEFENSHGLPNINKVPRMYKDLVQQTWDVTSEYNLEAHDEIQSNFIKRSTIQPPTLPQQLPTSDIDDMILKEIEDLVGDATIMPAFDLSEISS